MKKIRFVPFAFLMFAICVVGISLSSCSKEEKKVTPPAEAVNEEVYYIVGKVLEDAVGLENVSVTTSGLEAKTDAQGFFRLSVAKKGTYSVSFTKDGYVSETSKATIASDAGIFSSVVLSQTLTAKNPPVVVTTEGDVVQQLTIPAGGLTAPTEIGVTEYTDVSVSETSDPNSVNAPLATFNFEPDGLEFAKPATLIIPNPLGTSHFSKLTHLVLKDGQWKESGDAAFDPQANVYIYELQGFSSHSFVVPSTINTASPTEEVISKVEIDNTGNQAVLTQDVEVTQKYGWENQGPQHAPGEPGVSAALTAMTSVVLGSSSGAEEINYTFPYAVSGDTKATIEVVAESSEINISFPVIRPDGTLSPYGVSVKKYTGTRIVIKLEYGSSWTDHSGGGGQ
jgi:hypothetical protein